MNKRHSRFSRLNTLRGWSVAVIVVISAVTTPAFAQPWSGSSTLGVQIRGSNGPVEAALVEIRYRRPGLTAGPEARRTDAQGQANFVGITPGRWSLEIRHPDYLSFVASVNVETGRKTDVVTQFLEASGPGRKTFKVKFLRNDRPLGEAVPGTATHQATETKPPAPPRPAQASPEAPPPARQRVAPSQPPVPPPGETTPAPEPEQRSEEPTPPASSQKPEPVAPAKPGPVDPVPAPAGRAAIKAPEPQVAEQPSVGTPSPEEPAPEPPELPSPAEVMAPASLGTEPVPDASEDSSATQSPETEPSSLNALRDRTCIDCKPGEWAAAAEIEVPGGEPCRSTSEVAVRRAMRDIAAAASTELADFSGPLPTDLDQPPLSLASEAARNTLARYLDSSGSCRLLAIVIPEGGSFTGFRLEAADARAGGDCTGDQECEIGQARFLFSPVVDRGAGAAIVYSVFENTGGELRKAKMKGFFLPPSGWSPE